MAAAGRYRLLQLPRRADQRHCTGNVPRRDRQTLAADTHPAQPKGRSHLGSDHEVGRRLASQTAYPPSLAQPAICRPIPEVGAVCGKAARTDLCGGREATRVPTATHAPKAAPECNEAAPREVQQSLTLAEPDSTR